MVTFGLVHVASSYPLYPGDGTAPFMEEMLGALADGGHEVSVIVPRVEGLEEGQRSGVRVIGAPYAPRPLQVWGHGRSLDARNRLRFSAAALTPLTLGSMALTMRSEIRRHKPDVVHLHWVLPQGTLAFALPKNIPVVISAHGADARYIDGRLEPVARRVLARADAIVAASPQILESIAAVYPDARSKSHVIPHGANDNLIGEISRDEARSALGIDEAVLAILAIGRLVPEKGFHHLIGSLDHFTHQEAQIFIVGAGPLQQRLEKEALPQRERVHLIGHQTRDQVAQWLAASDVVVVPSVKEGGGLDTGPVVLMEALAAGRPVVATPVGLAPHLLEDGINGYLVKSVDPSILGSALNQALANRDRLGERARQSFDRIGGWDRVAQQLEAVYRDIIRQHQLD